MWFNSKVKNLDVFQLSSAQSCHFRTTPFLPELQFYQTLFAYARRFNKKWHLRFKYCTWFARLTCQSSCDLARKQNQSLFSPKAARNFCQCKKQKFKESEVCFQKTNACKKVSLQFNKKKKKLSPSTSLSWTSH